MRKNCLGQSRFSSLPALYGASGCFGTGDGHSLSRRRHFDRANAIVRKESLYKEGVLGWIKIAGCKLTWSQSKNAELLFGGAGVSTESNIPRTSGARMEYIQYPS